MTRARYRLSRHYRTAHTSVRKDHRRICHNLHPCSLLCKSTDHFWSNSRGHYTSMQPCTVFRIARRDSLERIDPNSSLFSRANIPSLLDRWYPYQPRTTYKPEGRAPAYMFPVRTAHRGYSQDIEHLHFCFRGLRPIRWRTASANSTEESESSHSHSSIDTSSYPCSQRSPETQRSCLLAPRR